MSDLFEQWNRRPAGGSRPSESAGPSSNTAMPPPSIPTPPAQYQPSSVQPSKVSGGSMTGSNPFSRPSQSSGGTAPPPVPVSSVSAGGQNPFAQATLSPMPEPQPIQPQTSIKPEDIFGLERHPIDGASMVVVGNCLMVMALPMCRILRWRVNRDQPPEEIEITKPSKGNEKIVKLFLDPHGFHLIICLSNNEQYYLHNRSLKPKKLSSWKAALSGCQIETCAFDSAHVSESSTRAILLGTDNGRIYEAMIDSQGKATTPFLHYTLEMNLRICSLHVTSVGGSGGSSNHDGDEIDDSHHHPSPGGSGGRLFVMCTTDVPTRLYSFLGGPSYLDLFKEVINSQTNSLSSSNSWSFTELGSLDANGGPRAELHCYERQAMSGGAGSASGGGTLFALLTLHGIYHGKLRVLGSASAHQVPSEAIVEPGLLPYENGSTPLSIEMTQYHFILLYPMKLIFLSRLSGNVVQEIVLDGNNAISGGGTMEIGLVRDETTKTVWLYSTRGIWKLEVNEEDRDVWLLSLERGLRGNVAKFDDALRHARSPLQRATVLTKQAMFHFDRQEYDKSARCYARASSEGDGSSFEEVALKFLDCGQTSTLELFLEEKLRLLDPMEDKMQVTMLCTWLLELYLARSINDSDEQEKSDLEHKVLDFLEEHRFSLDQETTFQLLTSHGNAQALVKYASVIEDSEAKYNRIAAHHAAAGNNNDLLRVLDLAPFDKVKELFYKYSSVLLENIPGPTVVVWKRKELSPAKLIPALVKYTHRREQQLMKKSKSASSGGGSDDRHHAIEYLEHCISSHMRTDGEGELKAMYNYLLLLHAKQPKANTLLSFLDRHMGGGVLDLEYALRVCKAAKQSVACVRLCASMRLYEDAVNLAIAAKDLSLAKQVASSVTEADGGDDVKRKLWMKIAEHCVTTIGITDPKAALAILDEVPKSSLVIKGNGGKAERLPLISVEDVLPFFEDLVTIDDFKDRIVSSLERYDVTIERLKKEMDEFTENAKEIHADMQTLQQRRLVIEPGTTCALSGQSLTPGPYYTFPSGYSYRQDALINHLFPHLPKHKQLKVLELCSTLDQPLTPATLSYIKRNKLTSGTSLKLKSSAVNSKGSYGVLSQIGQSGGGSSHGLSSSAHGSLDLKATSKTASSASSSVEVSSSSAPIILSSAERQAYQTQLDDLIAAECPLTGNIAIELVDEPLLSKEDMEAEKTAWEI